MSAITYDFSGKTALITGASGGIAREVARIFHGAGANLVLLDLAEEPLAQLVSELGGEDRIVAMAGDASSRDDIEALLELAAKRFGGLDYVLPVAGIYPEATVRDTSDELWRTVMQINLDGVFYLLRSALGHLRPGGAVVNFASVAGHRGSHSHGHYAASKAAVIALTRSLAMEVGPDIRVNAVSPGTIETPMTRDLVRDRGGNLLANTPMARYGHPSEVAAVAAFLCSSAASYMTGEVVHVNGGLFLAG
ncbi:3-oxoacyl-ACP reductase [Arthrobacter sp. SW1]|uniref:SDR family NAD(P)-dependent oxidoreductase n=1 Tax=Arthrobacter sp. SW1 TaxID=1920889 RepID=UPI000877D937|nr:SDR family NAD(P)-dependent oxidoreductase [Arthrobacter sp. SW1]OFI38856.1 3-oxoacyl-ACP reductase [Arthrobacter sp. SW1]